MFSELKQFNIGGAWVYVAQFDEATEVKPVLPAIRQQLIERCADLQTKRQRYCVWQLLDYALKQRIGNGVDELEFTVDGNGKWSCNGGVEFSLSHSGNAVAVAVSEQPVGIDVEVLDVERFNDRLAERILTVNERKHYDSLPIEKRPQALAAAWTQKESLFKLGSDKSFVSNAIDTTKSKSYCQIIKFGNSDYVVAVTR